MMDATYLKVLGALVNGERVTIEEIKTSCDLPDGYTAASVIGLLVRRGMILPVDGRYFMTKTGKRTFENETTPLFEDKEPKPNLPAPVERISPFMPKPMIPELVKQELKPKSKPGIRIINDHGGGVFAMFSDNVPLVPQKPVVHAGHTMDRHEEFPVLPDEARKDV